MVEVVFKGWMLNRTNMVRTDIEEDTNIKSEAVDSLHQVGLTRNFHNQVASSIINCLRHHIKEVDAFRCCQSRLEESFSVQSRIHSR